MGHQIRYTEDGGKAEVKTVRRYDQAQLKSPQRTREGFLRAQGLLTRAGVFEYFVRPDAASDELVKIRELRPPEEVFAEESRDSFALVPICLGHPPENLTPETARSHQRGSVSKPEVVEDHLRSDLLITDAEAISAVERGMNQLSCGYTSRVMFRPGVYTDGDGIEYPFDCVQTEIRGNHVAIVDLGRAGTSEIRLDSGDGIVRAFRSDQEGQKKMAKMSINGQEEDVSDGVAAYVKGLQDQLQAARANQEDPEQPPPKADQVPPAGEPPAAGQGAMEEKLKMLEGQVAALSEALATRDKKDAMDFLAGVRRDAAQVLGVDARTLEGKGLADIQAEVIQKVLPGMQVNRQDAAFLEGAYRSALQVASANRTQSQLSAGINQAMDAGAKERQDAMTTEAEKAHARYLHRTANAWKSPQQLAAESQRGQ